MDDYNPMMKDIKNLKAENESLLAHIKEKDQHIEQEAVYKTEERKKNDVLQFEIDSLRKRVELSKNSSHQLKDKLIKIAKEIVEIYGKEIKDKTKH